METARRIFAWDWVRTEALRALLTGQPEGVAAMLRLMCEDYYAMRDGFPDLMTEKDGVIGFLEVKAEGDVIRRNQLTRLRQLGSAGITANIARVDFRFDPEQDYVVVDIEATGGSTNGDRITEIGAVKIRNHEIIGEWHSLINPQRAIPANIIRLTGITNEMVRDAPLFAEVADSFMQFMEYGVFAAHNVNFDYGFISHEYERLERRFRFPKICTCAGMRRCYQGHKSYSLGALCEIYGISLTDHHRALCDARAAAHLRPVAQNRAHVELGLEPVAPRVVVRGVVPEALQDLGPVAGLAVQVAVGQAGRVEVAERDYEALHGADGLVLLTEWLSYRAPDFTEMRRRMRGPSPVVGNMGGEPNLRGAGGPRAHTPR